MSTTAPRSQKFRALRKQLNEVMLNQVQPGEQELLSLCRDIEDRLLHAIQLTEAKITPKPAARATTRIKPVPGGVLAVSEIPFPHAAIEERRKASRPAPASPGVDITKSAKAWNDAAEWERVGSHERV